MARRMMELAWMGSHAHTETARQEGNAYVDGTCEIAIPKRCDELALGEGSPQFMRQHGPVTRRRKHRHAVQSLHPMRAIRYVSAVATQDTVIQLRAAIRRVLSVADHPSGSCGRGARGVDP
jgi:hypothetical protein